MRGREGQEGQEGQEGSAASVRSAKALAERLRKRLRDLHEPSNVVPIVEQRRRDANLRAVLAEADLHASLVDGRARARLLGGRQLDADDGRAVALRRQHLKAELVQPGPELLCQRDGVTL